jgi:hypothetical protein
VTPQEVATVLRAHVGKRVRLTFDDGVVQSVDVGSVDDEGVLHSGPDGVEPKYYWTRFEAILQVEVAATKTE